MARVCLKRRWQRRRRKGRIRRKRRRGAKQTSGTIGTRIVTRRDSGLYDTWPLSTSKNTDDLVRPATALASPLTTNSKLLTRPPLSTPSKYKQLTWCRPIHQSRAMSQQFLSPLVHFARHNPPPHLDGCSSIQSMSVITPPF